MMGRLGFILGSLLPWRKGVSLVTKSIPARVAYITFYLALGNPFGLTGRDIIKTVYRKRKWLIFPNKPPEKPVLRKKGSLYKVVYHYGPLQEIKLTYPVTEEVFINSCFYALELAGFYSHPFIIYSQIKIDFLNEMFRRGLVWYREKQRRDLRVPGKRFLDVLEENPKKESIMLLDDRVVDSIPRTSDGLWREASVSFAHILYERDTGLARMIYVCNLDRKVVWI